MSPIPSAYSWLADEPGPRMLVEMLRLLGTVEAPGAADNPVILGWAQEIGVAYAHDEIAWCGLTIAVAAKRAGWEYRPHGNPLWARNWADWGEPAAGGAMLGDVLVFPRAGGGGHVAMYVGEDALAYHILGGNQGDRVSIARKSKAPILAIRRPSYPHMRPANVRKVMLSGTGVPVAGKES
jgi:uncharacterized protein (TIGR02594 family)